MPTAAKPGGVRLAMCLARRDGPERCSGLITPPAVEPVTGARSFAYANWLT
jgi:hypothetical protein